MWGRVERMRGLEVRWCWSSRLTCYFWWSLVRVLNVRWWSDDLVLPWWRLVVGWPGASLVEAGAGARSPAGGFG